MSRTYRRTKKINHSQKWKNCNHDYGWIRWHGLYDIVYDTQSDYYKENSRYYHGDGNFSWGKTKQAMQWDSKKKIRASERNQLSKVYRLEDYDDADYDPSEDRKVKQLWWVYF